MTASTATPTPAKPSTTMQGLLDTNAQALAEAKAEQERAAAHQAAAQHKAAQLAQLKAALDPYAQTRTAKAADVTDIGKRLDAVERTLVCALEERGGCKDAIDALIKTGYQDQIDAKREKANAGELPADSDTIVGNEAQVAAKQREVDALRSAFDGYGQEPANFTARVDALKKVVTGLESEACGAGGNYVRAYIELQRAREDERALYNGVDPSIPDHRDALVQQVQKVLKELDTQTAELDEMRGKLAKRKADQQAARADLDTILADRGVAWILETTASACVPVSTGVTTPASTPATVTTA